MFDLPLREAQARRDARERQPLAMTQLDYLALWRGQPCDQFGDPVHEFRVLGDDVGRFQWVHDRRLVEAEASVSRASLLFLPPVAMEPRGDHLEPGTETGEDRPVVGRPAVRR